MYIKQKKDLQFKSINFYPLNPNRENSISFIYLFFHDAFHYVYRSGINEFIEKNREGMSFEMIELSIDNHNDLIYLSESWHSYKNKPTTPEIERLLEEENFIKLCKMGFLDYVVMTKENFIHILFAWDKILHQLPPFALLYQDDKDWYDVLPFDTQEAMEQFVADHRQNNK